MLNCELALPGRAWVSSMSGICYMVMGRRLSARLFMLHLWMEVHMLAGGRRQGHVLGELDEGRLIQGCSQTSIS